MYVNFFGFSQMKVVVVVGEGGISLMKMVVVVVMVVGEGAGLSFWEVCPLLLKAEFLCTVPEKKHLSVQDTSATFSNSSLTC